MTGFRDIFDQYSWDNVLDSIYSKTKEEVRNALESPNRSLEDFKALLSPAATNSLEEIAQRSRARTLERFGNTVQLYAPMYLSNECQNICTYCGFSLDNEVPRRTLTDEEILREAMAVKAMGFKHILLVTGEANRTVGVEYLENALKLIKPHFAHVSLEVQPLEKEEYARLLPYGLNTVLVYQETYHRDAYKTHHPKGKKSNFYYRLNTPDRLGQAGVHKIGLGALIGLEDWRADLFFTALHLKYLEKRYWRTKYSISFPRLRPFSGGLNPKVIMSDRELTQAICAFRLLDDDVELSISTRERPIFRDNIFKLGVTTMSAASKTNPGGYVVEPQTLEQFEISDERSLTEITSVIKENGYEPVLKDWDQAYAG